jgi:hypothetical protein
MVLVSSFYMNIVLEAQLRDSDLWVYSWDSILRIGTLDLSTVVVDLERKFNLVFLQFKKPFTYY